MASRTFTDTEAYCHACKRWLPHSAFYRRTDSRYVRPVRSHCQSCERDAARRKYRRDPRRSSVTVAVTRAIQRGQLTRGLCEVCGDKKSQAHHDDYSKPLEVRWLCVRHHLTLHRAKEAALA